MNNSKIESIIVYIFWFAMFIAIYWFYPYNNEYLEIRCSEGIYLDQELNCAKGPIKKGALIRIFADKQSQKVLIKVEEIDDNWILNELYLKDCDIINEDNLKCKVKHGKQYEFGSFEQIYGVSDGKYYYSDIGGAPPDYYRSSISGWRLFAFNIGLGLEYIVKFSWSKWYSFNFKFD